MKKLKWTSGIVSIGFGFLALSSSAKDFTELGEPFWKGKPKLIQKMREERAVIVSVRSSELAKNLIQFHMQGAGWVSRSKDQAFAIARQYQNLKEVSSHFKTVVYDQKSDQLFVVTEALGYQARMRLQMSVVEQDKKNLIRWEVIWGHFKGMKGVIGFEAVARNKTEVTMLALYEADELPLPKTLIGFALEVVVQKVAEKMRSYLESHDRP